VLRTVGSNHEGGVTQNIRARCRDAT
jgi:hypothetical protein